MNSHNNTLNKFGIEYSYIALAMNNMLKSTNNNIKNININKTLGIAIDNELNCILTILSEIVVLMVLLMGIAAFEISTVEFGTPVIVGLLFLGGMGGVLFGLGIGAYFIGNSCFEGW
ncbi:hypothetical protein [Acidiplasma sp.]|uniref:hypothetical protein n=1 Tax=Acidiplasma sp. TaxID=1872114 RepID=UPI00258BB161|nr:hypothetical protein [Acidiplasma sp.]